ncbi:hypothetical protein CJJ18_08745 [Candidatus Williamhamiltonella defendens]|uniref:Uncharacterized protein n=1 Tax=Candidatus Williamhamiltonella defendens TaxID=138072 RepID=A0AAC9YH26_9ENTR|nr:hypothetical protein CJJ18_08745 [Candidatus Hamiltonella defensa]
MLFVINTVAVEHPFVCINQQRAARRISGRHCGRNGETGFQLVCHRFGGIQGLAPPGPTTTEVCSLNVKPAKRAISF